MWRLTSVKSGLVLAIPATKEEVADLVIHIVTGKESVGRTEGILNVSKMIINSRNEIAGRDESCGEFCRFHQVGTHDVAVADIRRKLFICKLKSWS